MRCSKLLDGTTPQPAGLSRREREILDIIYELGKATAQDVRNKLAGKPHYSTVRALLSVLEEKGHVSHREEGLRYTYSPVVSKELAAQNALQHLMTTFFDASAKGLLEMLLSRMSVQELHRTHKLVEFKRTHVPREVLHDRVSK